MLSCAAAESCGRAAGKTPSPKLILGLIILLDLAALVYFKYSGFFVEGILNPLLDSNFAIGDIVLPIGISFYTFQAISYSVDVYRGKYDGRPDFLEFCFYLSFFPLLLAGPITRAGRFPPHATNCAWACG